MQAISSEIIKEKVHEIEQGYEAENIPVKSYAALIGVYGLLFTGLFLASNRQERRQVKPRGSDWLFITLAAYKLSRIVTMSFIATPLRAPFTKRGRSLKGGEVQDVSRGEGMQKAIGNLLTCPFCFNVWATTIMMFGHSLFPRMTRKAAQILTIAAVGDVLHLGFRNLREKSE